MSMSCGFVVPRFITRPLGGGGGLCCLIVALSGDLFYCFRLLKCLMWALIIYISLQLTIRLYDIPCQTMKTR